MKTKKIGGFMKKVLAVCMMVLILIGFAEAYTTTTDLSYVVGVEKVIELMPPAGSASCNGEVIVANGLTLNSITTSDTNKTIETHIDQNGVPRFVMYGINDLLIESPVLLSVTATGYENTSIVILNAAYASPLAEPVRITDFYMTLSSSFDHDESGEFDVLDVAWLISQLEGWTDPVEMIKKVQIICNALFKKIQGG